MIKTKIFKEGLEDPSIDKQINKWIAKHPDYIVVDVKLGSGIYETDRAICFAYSALVIYREYENV